MSVTSTTNDEQEEEVFVFDEAPEGVQEQGLENEPSEMETECFSVSEYTTDLTATEPETGKKKNKKHGKKKKRKKKGSPSVHSTLSRPNKNGSSSLNTTNSVRSSVCDTTLSLRSEGRNDGEETDREEDDAGKMEAGDISPCASTSSACSTRSTLSNRFFGQQVIINRLQELLLIGPEDDIHYAPEELWNLLRSVEKVLKSGPSLVEVQSPVVVCGDLHGNYEAIFHIFRLMGGPGETHNFLFLGDYVDRGNRSTDLLALLFLTRLAYPKQFFLLRGNHETRGVNYYYNFLAELQEMYGQKIGYYLWESFNTVFDVMPFAGLVDNQLLCMHGGISPHINSLDDIRNIKRPLSVVEDNPLANDLIWSDPAQGKKWWLAYHVRRMCCFHACKGKDDYRSSFDVNINRGTGVVFDERAVELILQKLKLTMIIRAHQILEMRGYSYFADEKLLTIFSSNNYMGRGNDGVVAVITKKGEKPKVVSFGHHNKVNPRAAK